MFYIVRFMMKKHMFILIATTQLSMTAAFAMEDPRESDSHSPSRKSSDSKYAEEYAQFGEQKIKITPALIHDKAKIVSDQMKTHKTLSPLAIALLIFGEQNRPFAEMIENHIKESQSLQKVSPPSSREPSYVSRFTHDEEPEEKVEVITHSFRNMGIKEREKSRNELEAEANELLKDKNTFDYKRAREILDSKIILGTEASVKLEMRTKANEKAAKLLEQPDNITKHQAYKLQVAEIHKDLKKRLIPVVIKYRAEDLVDSPNYFDEQLAENILKYRAKNRLTGKLYDDVDYLLTLNKFAAEVLRDRPYTIDDVVYRAWLVEPVRLQYKEDMYWQYQYNLKSFYDAQRARQWEEEMYKARQEHLRRQKENEEKANAEIFEYIKAGNLGRDRGARWLIANVYMGTDANLLMDEDFKMGYARLLEKEDFKKYLIDFYDTKTWDELKSNWKKTYRTRMLKMHPDKLKETELTEDAVKSKRDMLTGVQDFMKILEGMGLLN